MTIGAQIKDETIQQVDRVNREAAKMSVLSSGKSNKFQYLTDKKNK